MVSGAVAALVGAMDVRDPICHDGKELDVTHSHARTEYCHKAHNICCLPAAGDYGNNRFRTEYMTLHCLHCL